jgi:hypothetical protein
MKQGIDWFLMLQVQLQLHELNSQEQSGISEMELKGLMIDLHK